MELTKKVYKEIGDYYWNKLKRVSVPEEVSDKLAELIDEKNDEILELLWDLELEVDNTIEEATAPKITQAEELAQAEAFVLNYQIDERR
jgi:hypothetical protein